MSPIAITLLPVALLCSAALLEGCGGGGGGGGDGPSGSTIPDIAGKTASLSTLEAALKAAGLVSTLKGTGPFTVFAPTNDAFDGLRFQGAELTFLLNNKDKLTEVLEYHVASGDVAARDLTNAQKIQMLMGGNVTVTITNRTHIMINDATVTGADVKSSNGVVHIIDKVLIPADFTAPSIPELAQSAKLATLVKAVTAANLSAALSGGPLTVFAPTDAAFASLPPGVLPALLEPANIKSLQQVLEYHVLTAEVAAEDIKSGDQQVKTLEGSMLNITKTGSRVQVNSATVTLANQFAVNGVVHVIDAVLLPPGFVPPTVKQTANILV